MPYSSEDEFTSYERSIFSSWEKANLEMSSNILGSMDPIAILERQLHYSDPFLKKQFPKTSRDLFSANNPSQALQNCRDLAQMTAIVEALAYKKFHAAKRLARKLTHNFISSPDDFFFRKLRSIFNLVLRGEKSVRIRRMYSINKEKKYVPELFVLFPDGRSTATNKEAWVEAFRQGQCTIRNCTARENGIVIKGSSLYVLDPAADPARAGFVAGQWKDLTGHPLNQRRAIVKSAPAFSETRTIDRAVSGLGRMNSNYWHQLIENLPATISALRASGCNSVLWSTTTPRSVTDLLIALCPEVEIILVSPTDVIHVRELIAPISGNGCWDSTLYAPNRSCNTQVSDLYDFYGVARSLQSKTGKYKGKYFFLIRAGARNTSDAEMKLTYLKKHNVELLDPSTLDIFEQIELFQTAAGIISPGGATWANTLFASKSVKFVNLVGSSSSIPLHHRFIAHGIGLDFKTVVTNEIQTQIESDFLNQQNNPLDVTLDDLEYALDLLVA